MSQSKIKAIIFDLDGVLCDSEDFIAQASVEMFKRRYKTEVDKAHFKQFIGAGESRFIEGVAEIYGITPETESDKLFTYEIYLDMISAGNMPPLTGVKDFILLCKSRGLKLAVASAADRIKVEGNLRQIGFPPENFDAVVTGCQVKNNKPAPDIFLKAAELIKVDPADCVVVEDALNGIIAATKSGARSLGISTSFTPEELKNQGANWTAPNLGKVPAEMLDLLY